MRGTFSFFLGTLFLFLSTASADQYFLNLRDDRSIPSHCQETQQSFFKSEPKTFTYGAQGATKRGFTFEYGISRRGATVLWRYLQGKSDRRSVVEFSQNQNEPTLLEDLKIIEDNKKVMDFDFGSEGEVLEILVLAKMSKHYDPEKYYFTGSVAYSNSEKGRRLGELDVLVGHKDSCVVIAVGEVKLGRRLGKAKGQLARFVNFYHTVLAH